MKRPPKTIKVPQVAMTSPADPRVAIQARLRVIKRRLVYETRTGDGCNAIQKEDFEFLLDQIAALGAEREIAQLRSALREYGQHKEGCPITTEIRYQCPRCSGVGIEREFTKQTLDGKCIACKGSGSLVGIQSACTCGLAALLAPSEGTK